MPVDVPGSRRGGSATRFFTDDAGGILDDLMVANRGDHLLLVVNAACKADDLAHLEAALGAPARSSRSTGGCSRCRGRRRRRCSAAHFPDVAAMRFMDVRARRARRRGGGGVALGLYRRGRLRDLAPRRGRGRRGRAAARRSPEVLPVGLGARDSLRLEAGLCLYGHDIDRDDDAGRGGARMGDPAGAARRAARARAAFPGTRRSSARSPRAATRRRVGLRPEGRAPMREGTELFAEEDGAAVGTITSGGFGPSLDAPVAMGYVPIAQAAPGTRLLGRLRGKMLPVTVAKMPFIAPGLQAGVTGRRRDGCCDTPRSTSG